MTINTLYQEAISNPQLFLKLIGINKSAFELLTPHFQLAIPQKLSLSERLFAALYVEHQALNANKTGIFLCYKNTSRDGAKFLAQAEKALTSARNQIVIPPVAVPRAPEVISPPVVVPAQSPQPVAQPVSLKKSSYGGSRPAPILISYRTEQGRRMHGAFYDHYTVRQITAHETVLSRAMSQPLNSFTDFIHNTTFALGINDVRGERIIPIEKDSTDQSSGLLIIPGHASNDQDVARKEHEQLLIAQARQRGQPVLALCAGSWRLWQAFGGTTKEVSGHLYSQMPYIITNGGIGNNKQIHRIELQAGSWLGGAMGLKDLSIKPTVNSVHWQAPDIASLPPLLEVSALAVADEQLKPRNRQGDMNPESEIEAFATKFGAPMLGVQWHPEAYYKNNDSINNHAELHLNLIRYMAKAGDAYQEKRRMNEEFHNKVAGYLSKFGIFSCQDKNESVTTLKPIVFKAI